MSIRISLIASIVSAGLLLLSCNSARQTKSTNPAQPAGSPALSSQIPTVNADGVRRVTTVELRDLLAKNEAVVIDVRNAPSYAAGHIRGAKLIPYTDVVKHANELPKDKLIVTYCS